MFDLLPLHMIICRFSLFSAIFALSFLMSDFCLFLVLRSLLPAITLTRSTAAARLRDVYLVIAKNIVVEDDEFGFYND